MTWTMIVLTGLIAAQPQFSLRDTDGNVCAGVLSEWNDVQLTLDTAEGRRSIAVGRLETLVPLSTPTAPDEKPSAWIELLDGSSLAASEFSVSGGQARADLIGGERLKLPTRVIAGVRFSPPGDDRAAQWAEILSADRTGDTVVLRKKEALDFQNGVLGDLTAESLHFELDGEAVAIKRSRLEGLIYFHPAGHELSAGVCRLTDAAGNRLEVRSAVLADGSLRLTTPAGIELSRGLEQIAAIDGKIQYISDLEPESTVWTPRYGRASQSPAEAGWYRPRSNQALEGGSLKLRGRTYMKGMAIHARTEIVYRLPRGRFGRFKALAGIDDRTGGEGNVRLVIYGDDKTLFEATFGDGDEPLPVEAPLNGVNRLKIVVDFGPEQSAYNEIDLCEARLLK